MVLYIFLYTSVFIHVHPFFLARFLSCTLFLIFALFYLISFIVFLFPDFYGYFLSASKFSMYINIYITEFELIIIIIISLLLLLLYRYFIICIKYCLQTTVLWAPVHLSTRLWQEPGHPSARA